jgi:hypothetical protein
MTQIRAKWGNDNDNSITYINPATNQAIPITPFAHKRWAEACVDGTTTKMQPPNEALFDPIKQSSSLIRPSLSRSQTRSGPTSNRAGQAESVGSILSGCAELIAASLGTRRAVVNEDRPRTPLSSISTQHNHTTSPAKNTPTKVSRFLSFAEESLNIPSATTFEQAFRQKGIGPDILHCLPDSELQLLGFTLGDTLRLKQAAPNWWKVAGNVTKGLKRKQREDDSFGDDGLGVVSALDGIDGLEVRVEKRWKDGSGAESGPAKLVKGNMRDDAHEQYEWWFRCDAVNDMIPVPPGYVPVMDSADTGIENWD